MKKLITLLIIVLSLPSCYEDIDRTVENPSTFTTVKLQELPKDTVVISIDGSNLFVFDANNIVTSHTIGVEDETMPIPIYIIIIFGFITLLLFILVIIDELL